MNKAKVEPDASASGLFVSSWWTLAWRWCIFGSAFKLVVENTSERGRGGLVSMAAMVNPSTGAQTLTLLLLVECPPFRNPLADDDSVRCVCSAVSGRQGSRPASDQTSEGKSGRAISRHAPSLLLVQRGTADELHSVIVH